jgi:hypothetical protein
MDEFEQMRSLMRLVEISDYSHQDIYETEEDNTIQNPPDVIEKLNLLVTKLRDHYEPEESEKSVGVELGMNMAADMIENLIKELKG